MLRLEELTWTSREEVCERLARFLRETSPQPHQYRETGSAVEPDRTRVLALFASLADDSHVPFFREMLWDVREETWARTCALQVLAGLEVTLPAAELERLMKSRSLWYDRSTGGSIFHVLTLCRTEEARQIARDFFESLSAPSRVDLLIGLCFTHGATFERKLEERRHPRASLFARLRGEWSDWIYHSWLQRDRLQIESVPGFLREARNLGITQCTRKRPASRAMLLDAWRGASGRQRRELLYELCSDGEDGVPASLVGGNPVELQELTEALVLDPADLRERLGPEGTLHAIEETIRTASREDGAEGEWRRRAYGSPLRRALDLLECWPGEAAVTRACSLLLCPDLHPVVRRELFQSLVKRAPERRGAVALLIAKKLRQRRLVQRSLHWIANDPVPADRDLLQWAAVQKRGVPYRYWGLRGLETLGEDGPEWRERLTELASDADDFVRLRAAAARARRGEQEREPEIVAAATGGESIWIRAEAIQILGELAPERHLPLFQRAILEDHDEVDLTLPAVDEASCALARLATPEAATVVIRCYLVACERACHTLNWHLPSLLARLEGEDALVEMPAINWRLRRPSLWDRH